MIISGRRAKRSPTIQLYNDRLSRAVDLRRQCKAGEWTLNDPTASALYELFEQLHEDVEDYIDLFARETVQPGNPTKRIVSTWSHFLKTARVARSRMNMSMVAVPYSGRLPN